MKRNFINFTFWEHGFLYSVGHSPQGSVLNITRLELGLQEKEKSVEIIEIIENNTNNRNNSKLFQFYLTLPIIRNNRLASSSDVVLCVKNA